MAESDISQVEQRLATVLKKERREAIGYALLAVLCTPVFLVIASIIILFVLACALGYAAYDIDVIGIYTGLNCFVALMIVIILKQTFSPDEEYEFDITWLVALIIFLVLLFLTYATKFPEKFPVGFGILYAVTAFFILGLLGGVYLNIPLNQYDESENPFFRLILAVTGFIAMSYGELLNSSWL
jgi:Mn2+/Fe2+ NRAMP family transporter